MCGICGMVGYGGERTLRRMRDTLVHRGPDSAGQVSFPQEQVGLGHRRLRIIDLSPEADQPMTQEDGSVWIVFNGEIYNFTELRKDLENRGHRFKSRSDTEVILHLYEEQGTKCFAQLNGIFALALLDRPRGKLILARDHLGVKPLYYHHEGVHFTFASEIKAILASEKYSRALNRQGMYDYFTFLYVPCPETVFEGIFQVPPAHVLELDLRSGQRRLWCYWQADGGQEEGNGQRSYEETKQELRDLLTDSVRRQMVSDVPLGVFLSGGVDSPVLTGLMAQASSRPVKTFSVIFQGKDVQFYNEQEAARAVAQKFGTEHHEIPVDIGDPEAMFDLVDYFDQPFGNPTFYLMYLISKHTRAEVTVALCGAGGDELFAGYPRYQAVALSRWLDWLPAPVLAGARGLARLMPTGHRATRLTRVAQFLNGLDRDPARRYVKWVYFFDEKKKRDLLNQGAGRDGADESALLPSDRIIRRYLAESRLTDFGNRGLHVDVQTFLVDNLLEYTDKMSMATSLEVRVPFLDPRFVERSLRVPFRHKLRRGRGKVILREAFADLLPEANKRLPKKGFNAPLAVWMRDRLDRYFDAHLGRARVQQQGIFNWDYLRALRSQHQAGERDNSYELFSILMFDVWYRKYLI
jgi:asparagine synthase (glutamine-hydrolysing)